MYYEELHNASIDLMEKYYYNTDSSLSIFGKMREVMQQWKNDDYACLSYYGKEASMTLHSGFSRILTDNDHLYEWLITIYEESKGR